MNFSANKTRPTWPTKFTTDIDLAETALKLSV